jgi:hypothetical protein
MNVFISQYQILGEGAYRQDILHNTTANDSNPYVDNIPTKGRIFV